MIQRISIKNAHSRPLPIFGNCDGGGLYGLNFIIPLFTFRVMEIVNNKLTGDPLHTLLT